jgi:hypothetical protein
MLRITVSGQDGTNTSVRLEGKLLAPWIEEVRGLFLTATSAPRPSLDLSGITFVDAAGTDLLRLLLRLGVHIDACSPYVAELLRLKRNQIRGGELDARRYPQ